MDDFRNLSPAWRRAPPEVNGMDERLKVIADAVAAVGRIDAVPILRI
jgi:hypothetical protein